MVFDKVKPSTFTQYLVKAYLDWCNDTTGRCLLSVHNSHVTHAVLKNYISPDGYLHLNIGGDAVRNLVIDKEGVSFRASFKNVPVQINLTYDQIAGVFYPATGVMMALHLIPIFMPTGDLMVVNCLEQGAILKEEDQTKEPATPAPASNVVNLSDHFKK